MLEEKSRVCSEILVQIKEKKQLCIEKISVFAEKCEFENAMNVMKEVSEKLKILLDENEEKIKVVDEQVKEKEKIEKDLPKLKVNLEEFNVRLNELSKEQVLFENELKNKTELIEKLKKNNFMEIYQDLKNRNLKDAEIANTIILQIIRNSTEVDINDRFTLSELEEF